MKILVLTHSYPDSNNKWRGIFVREQVEALSSKHDVIVVYFKADYSHFAPFSDYSYSERHDGKVIVYEVTVNKSFPVITQAKFLSATYRFIRDKILDQDKIDIIHSHLSYPGGFLGTIIQEKRKLPNVITEHSRIKLYFRSWLHKKCVSYALRKATCVISVSTTLKEEIVAFSNRPVIVIPNIADTGKFELSETKPGKIINIGFLGSLNNNNKGLDLLLLSVTRLGRKDFFLHIGGNGILLDNFKKMAGELGLNNNCRFYGEIIRNEISDFYSKLDFFILPSRYETFGIVLIEAMACGIPVIATKCGGPKDIVTPATGILIEKENIEELKDAIIRMSENAGSYKKEVIREYAKSNFGQEVFVQRLSELYQKILTGKSNE